jgi:molybdopterin molybdotransferase
MKRPDTFLEPESASAVVMEMVRRCDIEMAGLAECRNRALAEILPAQTDQPRFRKAAVDGYALAGEPGDQPVRVVGSIAAGDHRDPDQPAGLTPGRAVRIMTGAVVPPDIERIIRFEYTETLTAATTANDGPATETPQSSESVRIIRTEHSANIAERGENIRRGDPVLTPRRITPVDIGILASQGYARVPVFRRPSVAVFSTGTELVAPGDTSLEAWAIHDSNSYQIAALAEEAGAAVTNYGILPDDQARITAAVRAAINSHDVVICSGGVSMGVLDFFPTALESLGARIHFHGLAMKPGRPTLFATSGATLVFGLPGNPVSTLVQFELFIAPTLAMMQGLTFTPRETALPLAKPFSRRNADRHEYLPGYIRDGKIERVTYQGSGHLSALSNADVIFRIDRGVTAIPAGEHVYARYIRPTN